MKTVEKNVYTMYHYGMKIQINQWGNSLAIRIPKSFAKEMKINPGSELDMRVQENKLVLSKPEYTLEEIVKGITPNNTHREIDWGPPVGKEIW